MDEPFSALDPLIRSQLQGRAACAAAEPGARKAVILFVQAHDLDEGGEARRPDHVLEGGRIVQTGSPEDIVLRPADAYVAEFVQHMNPLVVLSGRMTMRHRHELEQVDGAIWLDSARQYQLVLGTRDEPIRVVHRGAPIALCDADKSAPRRPRPRSPTPTRRCAS